MENATEDTGTQEVVANTQKSNLDDNIVRNYGRETSLSEYQRPLRRQSVTQPTNLHI